MKRIILTAICGVLVMLTAPSCSEDDSTTLEAAVEQNTVGTPAADGDTQPAAKVWHVTLNAKTAPNGISKALTGDYTEGFKGKFAEGGDLQRFFLVLGLRCQPMGIHRQECRQYFNQRQWHCFHRRHCRPLRLGGRVVHCLDIRPGYVRHQHFDDNPYGDDDWSKMESAGAVFLPAVGYRAARPSSPPGSAATTGRARPAARPTPTSCASSRPACTLRAATTAIAGALCGWCAPCRTNHIRKDKMNQNKKNK